MGTNLNKEAYKKMINENIESLEEHMPKHSLEKKHTIQVLLWSIDELYKVIKKSQERPKFPTNRS